MEYRGIVRRIVSRIVGRIVGRIATKGQQTKRSRLSTTAGYGGGSW